MKNRFVGNLFQRKCCELLRWRHCVVSYKC